MFIRTIVAALASAIAVAAQQPVWSSCASTTDMLVTSFSVAPYPLCIGKNACFTATGSLLLPVTDPTTVMITGKYLGRLVYSDNQDGCSIFVTSGYPCPVPITVTSLTFCVLIKWSTPANIGMAMVYNVVNGNGHILMCQAATVVATNCV